MAEYTERQAQVAMDHSKHLENVKIKSKQTYNTKAECIRGCDITVDGKILLTDYIGKCLTCIDTGITISTAPYRAFDVTCIDDTTVAVTSGTDKVINIVDISSRAVKKHIDVGYDCYGVTHRDGTLLVCALGHGILSINLTNEKITTIVQCDDLPSHSYITTYKDKLYYTNDESRTVTCCGMEGNTMWTFKDGAVLHSPRGITTDKDGRVYVCDDIKDHVIVLSYDGKQSKKIITRAEGLLLLPHAIHFDKKRNNLLTTNYSGRVFWFNVSSVV